MVSQGKKGTYIDDTNKSVKAPLENLLGTHKLCVIWYKIKTFLTIQLYLDKENTIIGANSFSQK